MHTLADYKDFCRLMARGLGLGGLDMAKQLLKDPQQGLIVTGTENLCDEAASTGQKITSQTKSHQCQMGCEREIASCGPLQPKRASPSPPHVHVPDSLYLVSKHHGPS